MSFSTKAFFAVLTLFSLLCIILCYEGIARLERLQFPPFPPPNTMFHVWGGIPPPSDKLLLFIHSTFGHVLAWLAAIAIPLTCGIVAFRQEKSILGFAILIAWAALCGWIGLRTWMHAVLDAG
jgi:hypothetical protein